MTATRTELAAIWPPTAAAAAEAGHAQMSPLSAIREKCRDCCGNQVSEIRLCEAVKCALWPFRAGRHPYHGLAGKQARNPANALESEAIQSEGPAAAATAPGHVIPSQPVEESR